MPSLEHAEYDSNGAVTRLAVDNETKYNYIISNVIIYHTHIQQNIPNKHSPDIPDLLPFKSPSYANDLSLAY